MPVSHHGFHSARGGHAPGELRNAFVEMIESGAFRGNLTAEISVGGCETPVSPLALTGLLWNCTDILPGGDCDELDIPLGSTYAQGARDLHRWWSRQPQTVE